MPIFHSKMNRLAFHKKLLLGGETRFSTAILEFAETPVLEKQNKSYDRFLVEN